MSAALIVVHKGNVAREWAGYFLCVWNSSIFSQVWCRCYAGLIDGVSKPVVIYRNTGLFSESMGLVTVDSVVQLMEKLTRRLRKADLELSKLKHAGFKDYTE
ncbi:MAG: hypothetical protein QNK24_04510 [Desulfuromusa sp.]|nr:hypothetical protein [Desulfuromusa sp.]